ncbi:MAG: endonuclease/exonuclease/phosphatase family protein [Bifidobacterium tibiigranuli]|jgi:endonuclease/exonuclease/phosphatase family metal-dependent hydrolase|nr:endonuclease/exonuclease/phosphatase family protein [Bifidobacterium tibiigranuli]
MAAAASQPYVHKGRHRILGAFAGLFVFVALLGTIARMLPESLQSLPYVPVVVSVTPWFTLLAALALILALVARRWGVALLALVLIGVQIWWQAPFFRPGESLPAGANNAVSSVRPNTDDAYARVMTMNVYKGHADARTIVNLVRDQHVEVLALQETTDAFIAALKAAGLGDYLPYSQVSSSDGVYGNGLWSASPLGNPVDDEVDSSASFMPGGTVQFNGSKTAIRFVSVHTTSPKPGMWEQWRRSQDELGMMRTRTDARYVFMGDFNSTTDHTAFRNFLGTRFRDAAQEVGHGFTFTWPQNRPHIPAFAGIDHVVLDQGITAGQITATHVPGSDHAALLATIAVR